MKIFQKLLFPLLLLWVVAFGGTVYLSFWGLDVSIERLSHEAARLAVNHLKPLIESGLTQYQVEEGLKVGQQQEIGRRLRSELIVYDTIEDFLLVSEHGRVLFGLNNIIRDSLYVLDFFSNNAQHTVPRSTQIRLSERGGVIDAVWRIADAGLFGVVRINPKSRILRTIRHNLTIKFYLVGFFGVLGMIILSLIAIRMIKSPLTKVDKAMSVIDKRKYGHRIKWKSDDEFGELYQRVNQALRRMEQLDTVQRNAVQRRNVVLREMKTILRFLDIMAHEIKNPLHALGINLDVLKTKIKRGQSKESALKHTEILEHELEHLQEVVLGFLSYVRPGIPKKERANINQLIKSVCQMAAAEAQKAKVMIETRLSKSIRQVLVDPGQLKQALHNVVINAVHATGEGGKINIRSWARKRKVLIEVKDNGSGISKEELKKIFDLYYTTKKSGTGLGLPVTKRIVEANGGQMQLESNLGKGTKITFVFES